jgi:hypothetical protein
MSTLELFVVDIALRAIGHAVGRKGAFTPSWEG